MEKNFDVIIVGGGLSGLSVAHFLGKQQPGLKICIVEKADRPGGAIKTFKQDGYQAEWGPHGFLNNTSESRQLLRDIGLDQEMQSAPLGDFRRFICFNGNLEALPQSPKMLLATPLLTSVGKMRLLADLWKKPRLADQTIGDWAAYRFGRGVLPMVDVAVTGTFAGDLHRLSIDAVMPGVRQLEKSAGSVLRGLKAKNKISAGQGGLPAMINFPAGMERIIEALASRQDNLLLATAVKGLAKDGSDWLVQTDKDVMRTPRLIMALPVNSSLQLLKGFQQPPILAVPEARIINVVMGFGGEAVVPRGFGYLAPEREGRFALGAMFSSHMFPDRCPAGQVLLEVLVGGRRHPERLELADEELISKVYDDISKVMVLPAPPIFTKVLRSAGGIPQLEMDHPALLAWRQEIEAEMAGLHICGFGWDGIGMNDVIKSAARTVEAVVAGHSVDTGQTPVKPVYF